MSPPSSLLSQGSRKDVFREYLGPWNVSKYYFYREYCKTLVLTWILWSPNSKAKNRPRWEQHLKRLNFLKNLHSMYLASQCQYCPITRLGSIETSNRLCAYCNLGITIHRCTTQLTTWASCNYNSAEIFSTPPIMGSLWLHRCRPSKKVIVIFTDGLSWTFTISDTFLNLHCSISWPSNCWTSRAQWALPNAHAFTFSLVLRVTKIMQ